MRLKNLAIITVITFGLIGCGYKELPTLKDQATSPFKDMMLQYRLRADIAYNLSQILKTNEKLSEQVQSVLKNRSQALQIQLSLNKFDFKQNNRFQSYQNFISRDVDRLIKMAQENPEIKKSPAFMSQVDQWNRANQKLVRLKRNYLTLAQQFNKKKETFPHTWYNKFKYHFEPLPVIGDLASVGGQ